MEKTYKSVIGSLESLSSSNANVLSLLNIIDNEIRVLNVLHRANINVLSTKVVYCVTDEFL